MIFHTDKHLIFIHLFIHLFIYLYILTRENQLKVVMFETALKISDTINCLPFCGICCMRNLIFYHIDDLAKRKHYRDLEMKYAQISRGHSLSGIHLD